MLQAIKNHGLIYTGAILFNRIVPRWLFRSRRFVVYQLSVDPIPKRKPGDTSVHVRWSESEPDIKRVEQLTRFCQTDASRKTKCCLAEMEGRLVGGLWVATDQFDETELGLRIELNPKQAWLFSVYIDKGARRRGVYTAMLRFVISELVSEGYGQLLVAVNPHNRASNCVHRRHASRTVGTVLAVRFLRATVCFSKGDVRRNRWLTRNSTTSPLLLRCGEP